VLSGNMLPSSPLSEDGSNMSLLTVDYEVPGLTSRRHILKKSYLQGQLSTLFISALGVTKLRIQSLSAFRYSG